MTRSSREGTRHGDLTVVHWNSWHCLLDRCRQRAIQLLRQPPRYRSGMSPFVVLVTLRSRLRVLLGGATASSATAAVVIGALAVRFIFMADGASPTGSFRVELMSISRSMGSATTFRCDFKLLFRIHRCKTTVACISGSIITSIALPIRHHNRSPRDDSLPLNQVIKSRSPRELDPSPEKN
jgi:hypothetical protein